MDVMEKLKILADAAKYDAACTSSGVDRKGGGTAMGSSRACGICHSFAGDGRCISLLKVFCYNNAFAGSQAVVFEYGRERAALDIVQSLLIVRERRIRSSGDIILEQMLHVLELLRRGYGFGGYIHVKVIPGADPLLIEKMGFLADRISVNIELPSAASLQKLAPDKHKENLLGPMRQIRNLVAENQSGYGRFRGIQPVGNNAAGLLHGKRTGQGGAVPVQGVTLPARTRRRRGKAPQFAPAGQSTQMIIGASPESDRQILRLTEQLYHAYDLKRVFYSAYVPVLDSDLLPAADTPPPLWREHRLYQANWLLRFYGFRADELLTETDPQLHPYLDPKCRWALRHPEFFPLEVNRAAYDALLRVPGLGVESALRIVRARKFAALSWDGLKNIGIVLKRARYFLVCNGKRYPHLSRDREGFLADMMSARERILFQKREKDIFQPSLFDETGLPADGSVPRLTDPQKEELAALPIPLWD